MISHVDVFQTISHVDVFQTISQSEDEGPSLQTVSDPSRLPGQEASPRTKDTQAYKVTVGHLLCNCSSSHVCWCHHLCDRPTR